MTEPDPGATDKTHPDPAPAEDDGVDVGLIRIKESLNSDRNQAVLPILRKALKERSGELIESLIWISGVYFSIPPNIPLAFFTKISVSIKGRKKAGWDGKAEAVSIAIAVIKMFPGFSNEARLGQPPWLNFFGVLGVVAVYCFVIFYSRDQFFTVFLRPALIPIIQEMNAGY
jgi:hypothetical protein